jgi:hypothetical protein
VKWQPEPDQRWPEGPGSDQGPLGFGSQPQVTPPQVTPPPVNPGSLRRRVRQVAFSVVLTAGLAGLALSAVGIAHQLLPRRFTPAQRRAISAWEMQRRWRALPAGEIFPATVSYQLPSDVLSATSNLVLDARRLGISPAAKCSSAVTGIAIRVLSKQGCSGALRATYVDSSGSMVATVTVAVLPSTAAADAAIKALPAPSTGRMVSRALRIARTPAAGFDDDDRQLSHTEAVGPYVIMVTVGFSDGRHHMQLTDPYVNTEMGSLVSGLTDAATAKLGAPLPVPSCPGAPGC